MQIEIKLEEALVLDAGDLVHIDYDPGDQRAFMVCTKPTKQNAYGGPLQADGFVDVVGYAEEGELY